MTSDSEIRARIQSIKNELPQGVDLVAVSKFHTPEKILSAYSCGQRIFAESRPQELEKKVSILPKDIEWHFIGHLQTNKLKMVLPYVKLIHSVDSKKLLLEIDKYSQNHSIVSNCLLEIYIAQEDSKQGFTTDQAKELLDELERNPLKNTNICGLMGMASFTSDREKIEEEFALISSLMQRFKAKYTNLTNFNQLSIGMSADYKIALKYGSTFVRIGTDIFGEREY